MIASFFATRTTPENRPASAYSRTRASIRGSACATVVSVAMAAMRRSITRHGSATPRRGGHAATRSLTPRRRAAREAERRAIQIADRAERTHRQRRRARALRGRHPWQAVGRDAAERSRRARVFLRRGPGDRGRTLDAVLEPGAAVIDRYGVAALDRSEERRVGK